MLFQSLDLNFITKFLTCFFFSFFITWLSIKRFIAFTKSNTKFFQPIRADGPKQHLQSKKNTPTMGGIFIILATILTSFLFSNLNNHYILVTMFVMASFAAIGLTDDLLKVIYKNPNGFRGSIKIVIQFAIVGLAILWLGNINSIHINNLVIIPFTNDFTINLGVIYFIFATFVIVGSSNAVNLTDGLDGLVSVPAIIGLICFAILIFASFDLEITTKTSLIYIGQNKELLLVIAALIGAIFGFLLFNLKPAKIFMGDVGSLAIGATLGLMAIITKTEILFFFFSLLFVAEAVSVILQVVSYKIRKKRIFLMAPLHHHFEKLGWSEKKVVRSFWLASLLLAIITFIPLFIQYKLA